MADAAESEFAYNERLKEFDDATTEIAEMLEGSMRTPVEFYYDGQELHGRDGRKLSEVARVAIDDAINIVSANPNLAFEYRRRLLEQEEIKFINAMAANPELPNTLIVISDFPPELSDIDVDVGGYNAARKQTYLRVYTRQTSGNIKLCSQSLDLSNRQALEEIYNFFGEHVEEGELLGQTISRELTEEEQKYLIDYLTGIYDQSLTKQFGGSWYAGRSSWQRRNTYDFVCKQPDLVQAFITAQKNRDNTTLYNIAAAMQNRFDIKSPVADFSTLEINYIDQLHFEILTAGNQARVEGKSFSACGVTLTASGDELNTQDSLKENGFGNKTDEATKYNFDKKMYCVKCQDPPKKDEAKKMCGPCGICKSCDARLKKKS